MQARKRTAPAPELAGQLIDDARDLVKLELQLAKQEALATVKSNGVAIGLFAGAGLLLMLTLLVAVPVFLVQVFANHVLVALIWIVLYLLLVLVLALVGWRMLTVLQFERTPDGKRTIKFQPPQKTIESVKETQEWATRQIRSPGR
jgi:uncharacterized protein (DUF58 family)